MAILTDLPPEILLMIIKNVKDIYLDRHETFSDRATIFSLVDTNRTIRTMCLDVYFRTNDQPASKRTQQEKLARMFKDEVQTVASGLGAWVWYDYRASHDEKMEMVREATRRGECYRSHKFCEKVVLYRNKRYEVLVWLPDAPVSAAARRIARMTCYGF